MKVAVSVLVVLLAAPAFAQAKDARPAQLPEGTKELGNRQPVEQDLPGSLSGPEVERGGLRIRFAQRYVDAPAPSAELGKLDTGSFATFAKLPQDRLVACGDALGAALDRLVADAAKLGANAVVAVSSYDPPAGYLPAHPAFLCVQSVASHGGSVVRVRLVGVAAKLP